MYKLCHDIGKINEEDPFANCKLNRKRVAFSLTKLITSFGSGVIALDNAWGTGKTTFLKMWEAQLKKEKYTTVHFNAWENDYLENIFTVLLYELGRNFNLKNPKKNDKKYLDILKNASLLLIEKSLGSMAKDLTKGIISPEKTKYEKQVQVFLDQRKVLQDFQDKLENLAVEKPIIFLIDELDRCKPDYAIRFLEIVKHLFIVKNFVFVLAVDKKQLEASIKGAYGDSYDSKEYLRRFFDVELSLPTPNYGDIINHFDSYFSSQLRLDNINEKQRKENDYGLKFAEIIFRITDTSLRTIEKSIAHMNTIYNSLVGKEQSYYLFSDTCLIVIDLKYRFRDLYQKVSSFQLEPQDLIDEILSSYELDNDIKDTLSNLDKKTISIVVGRLVYHYIRGFDEIHKSELFKEYYDWETKTNKLKHPLDQVSFDWVFKERRDARENYEHASLQIIIDRVSLINSESN